MASLIAAAWQRLEDALLDFACKCASSQDADYGFNIRFRNRLRGNVD